MGLLLTHESAHPACLALLRPFSLSPPPLKQTTFAPPAAAKDAMGLLCWALKAKPVAGQYSREAGWRPAP